MLEELFVEGYLDVNKLILDYYTNLDLNPTDVVVLIKILEYIKQQKKIRISKLSQDTALSKPEVERALESLTEKKLYGTLITTNENGVADERPTIKPLFDKLEMLINNNQVQKVQEELEEIVELYQQGANKVITPMEYNKIEGFVKEGFLPAEIRDAVKATIKKGNVNMNAVERVLLKNHHQMLDDNDKSVDAKKSADFKKALAMIK
ncbi:MAG: hypothetical protein K6G48_05320 [Acholeplasmatales bacterium]|nr:hypothetical protein [Acholeplasmatales bacterium]